MQLTSLRVSSLNGLCINCQSFHPLTLLVGVSGAGKSQILCYIYQLFRLLEGHVGSELEDGEYEIKFTLDENKYQYLVYVQDHFPSFFKIWCNDEILKDPSELILDLPTVHLIPHVSNIRGQNNLTHQFILATPQQREEITSLFKVVFETIETIEIQNVTEQPLHLYFKEENGPLLPIESLSDGMLKTFYLICEIVLSEPGALLLIDEFENGLGLNCMGPLLEEVMARENISVILSSHHPYVLNNIPTSSWMIVSRENSLVHVQTAEEFGIGQTKYDAFFELVNRLDFEGGI